MKAYLTYAINQNGDLVHVDSVANGNDCGCYCPHCKSGLCAKNGGTGEKMIHHFAHLSGSDCAGAIESALHKMAKNVLKESLCLQLPNRLNGIRGEQLRFDRVEVEFYDKETCLRPDCIGYYGDRSLWIEFKRTHAVDVKKKGKIISAKIDCVELDLNGCELDPNAVRKFIVEETERRIWIRDNNVQIREAGCGSRYVACRYEYDELRPVKRTFAKDENGVLVNLLDDEVDLNVHTYFCLACGRELSIDVNETGEYSFAHLDEFVFCEDDLYLREAAKNIIAQKFRTSKEFNILVPQNVNCAEKEVCVFFNPNECLMERRFSYNLKAHGYNECLQDFKLPGRRSKCDLVFQRNDGYNDAIAISIKAGSCHVDVDDEKLKIIEIEVLGHFSLWTLLNKSIGETSTSFINFKRDNGKTVSRSEIERGVLKFSLFRSGKYYLETVSCSLVNMRKNASVMELLFTEQIENWQEQDAKWYSLLKCYEQKRKACYCEICFFFDKPIRFYGVSEAICKRYKTKGTPHYPLREMPVNCPYFKVDKSLEEMIKSRYGRIKVIQR